VPTHFNDSTWELTTSTMKKGVPGTNGSDLNKNNIIKSTLDHLSEEDCKTLKAYHKEVDEIFLSRNEVTQYGLIQKDATPINIRKSKVTPEIRSNPSFSLDDVQVMINSNIRKSKVTPEVRSNPSFSLDDVQVMINSVLERQVKSSNELMRKLIVERDRKKLVDSNVHAFSSSCAVNFAQTNHQPSDTLVDGTSQPNPSAQPMNHFYN
jgi:hypothetical protein